MSEYSHYCFSGPGNTVYILYSGYFDPINKYHPHSESSINIIQLKTHTNFWHKIGFLKACYHGSQKQYIQNQVIRLGQGARDTNLVTQSLQGEYSIFYFFIGIVHQSERDIQSFCWICNFDMKKVTFYRKIFFFCNCSYM